MTVRSQRQPIVAWNYYGNSFKGKLRASEKLFEDKTTKQNMIFVFQIQFSFTAPFMLLADGVFFSKLQRAKSKNNIIQE